MSDYESHPMIKYRLEVMPQIPFAVYDHDAYTKSLEENPPPDPFSGQTRLLEFVLWSSEPVPPGATIGQVGILPSSGDSGELHIFDFWVGERPAASGAGGLPPVPPATQ